MLNFLFRSSRRGLKTLFLTGVLFVTLLDGQDAFNFKAPITLCNKFAELNVESVGIASDKNLVFLPLADGNLDCINVQTGERLWKSELGGKIVSRPVLDKTNGKDLYIATASYAANESLSSQSGSLAGSSVYLRSMTAATGLTNWVIRVDETAVPEEEIFLYTFGDKIFVVGKKGYFAAHDKASGKKFWKTSFGNKLSAAPFFNGDKVILALGKRIVVVSAEAESANVYFQFETLAEEPTAVFLSDNKILFWGDSLGKVYALNIESKKVVWKYRNGARISHILPTPKGLLLTSFDNFIYLVSANKGKLVWKKRLTDRITVEPLVVGNFVIVTSGAGSEALVLELRDGRTINEVRLPADDLLLSSPLLADNLLAFVTIGGVFTYSHAGGKCLFVS